MLELIVANVLLPGALGALVGLPLLPARWRAVGLSAAIATAAAVALPGPPAPPAAADGWLVHLVLVAGIVGARPRASALLALCALAAGLLLPPSVRGGGTSPATAIGAAALLVGQVFASRQLDERVHAGPASLLYLGWLGATAAAAAASGTLRVGQFGALAGAALGGLWLVSRVRDETRGHVGPVVAVVGWSVLALAYCYAELPSAHALALAAPPMIAAAAARFGRCSYRAMAAVAILAIAAGGAAAAAGAPAPPTSESNDYGYEATP